LFHYATFYSEQYSIRYLSGVVQTALFSYMGIKFENG